MGTKKRHFLILDANILIDFYKCDRTIIKLICTYVGQIYLATPVLSEIKEIDEGVESSPIMGIIIDCIAKGLTNPEQYSPVLTPAGACEPVPRSPQGFNKLRVRRVFFDLFSYLLDMHCHSCRIPVVIVSPDGCQKVFL